MKKILSLLIVLGFSLLITGCGKPDETWNGVYTNGTDYSILIFTGDNNTASIAVMQKGENYQFYPVEYENYLKVTETELTTINGEPVKVVKDGLKIKISLESEEKGVWANIEGEYTKIKNVKSFDLRQL